jgi:2-phosphosulfolactate phosphatase
MKVHLLFSPLNADELYFTGKTVVVIDVLRATTTILAALSNGAREITPVESVDFAVRVSGNAGGLTLLAGERNAVKIEGFALGNSPLEFSEENVRDKSIVFYTTNGSKAIVRAKFAENLFVASFNNIRAVAEKLLSLKNDVEIMCAGSNGMFCVEDSVAAGFLVDELKKRNEEIELTDAAKVALVLKKHYGKNVLKMLRESEHGKELIEKGFEEDLKFAAKLNSLDLVPFYENGSLKISDEESLPKV